MADLKEWLQQIVAGEASLQLKEMAAKGLIPFPAEEMLQALAVLAEDDQAEIREQAVRTTAGMPRDLVRKSAAGRGGGSLILRHLARSFAGDEEVIMLLAGNADLPDENFALLCESSLPPVLEVLARNQERLRRNYDALMRLLGNPALPLKLRGYLLEEKERRRAAEAPPPEEAAEELEHPEIRFEEVLIKDFSEEDKAVPPHKRQEVQERRHQSVYQILRTLNAGEKLILAMKGNKEARYLLVRDSNKQVASKVLESPRLTDSEVEMFAKMTNVCEEVLRGIANTKEWIQKYNIMRALTFNPKTPMGIALPMISKLTVRDLSFMARNRNVPEVVRQTAARLYRLRREQRGG